MSDGRLRVSYNASALPERPAGAGVYTVELGRALAARSDVELVAWAPRPLGFGEPMLSPVSRKARFAAEATGRVPSVSGVDVYHGPHMFTPRTTVPAVATVHDLTFFRLPSRYTFPRRRYYRFLAGTAKRADRIIVPSVTVAGDVVRFLGYPPERIRVIAEAPRAGLAPASAEDVGRLRSAHGLKSDYLLCLGTAEPGKRAVDAIRAMPAILDATPRTVLVLAGNDGPLSAALRRESERLGLGDSVRFIGYVADGDLPALLTGAAALVFPSLYEGFGLPPLEALACGAPVITTDAPAMRDVLREAAAFVPLRDHGAIAREAIRLLTEPTLRTERSARGLEFVKRFSWDRAAEETVDVYREVAG